MMVFYLDLPHEDHPSPNKRQHWSVRNRLTQSWRHNAHMVAAEARMPKLTDVRVTLFVTPGDKRRRDVDNLSLVRKAAVDGIVDAGVCEDDCWPFVVAGGEFLRAPDSSWRWQLRIEGQEVFSGD